MTHPIPAGASWLVSLLPAQTCVTYSQQSSQCEPLKHQIRLCYSSVPVPYHKSLPWPAEPCIIWLLETSLCTPPNPRSLFHAGLITVPLTYHQASASGPLPCIPWYAWLLLHFFMYLGTCHLIRGTFPNCHSCSPGCACSPQLLSSQPVSYGCFFIWLLTLCIPWTHRMLALWAWESCFPHICISRLWIVPAGKTAKFIFPEVTNWDTQSHERHSHSAQRFLGWEGKRDQHTSDGTQRMGPMLQTSMSTGHSQDSLNLENTRHEGSQAVPGLITMILPSSFLGPHKAIFSWKKKNSWALNLCLKNN